MKILAEDYINAEGKIDTSWNAFDRMIERDKIGDKETLRVKNPYNNSLPDTDTKFLKSWLETINKIRYPETNGDHTTAEA
jgi:hypothetical protein